MRSHCATAVSAACFCCWASRLAWWTDCLRRRFSLSTWSLVDDSSSSWACAFRSSASWHSFSGA
eukprot:4077256-Heterocapsa_arctica.AAC.1